MILESQDSLGVWFLEVKISTTSPCSRRWFRLLILPLILTPTTWPPISEWRRKAKSSGREPLGRSMMSPFGV